MRIQVKPNDKGGFVVIVDGEEVSNHKTFELAQKRVYNIKNGGKK